MYAVSNITLQQADPEPRQEEQAVAVSVYIHIIIPPTNSLNNQQHLEEKKKTRRKRQPFHTHFHVGGSRTHARYSLRVIVRCCYCIPLPHMHSPVRFRSVYLCRYFPPFIATAGSLAPTHTDEGWGRVVWARVGAWWQAMEGRGRRISPPSRLSPLSCTASCSRSSTALLCSQRSPASTALSTSKSCDH